MTVYGKISDYKRASFKAKFKVYFTLNPTGSEWMGLAEALGYVNDRIEFRHSFSWSDMVTMLRQMCVEAGLTREDRGGSPHVLEGYYGLERKQA